MNRNLTTHRVMAVAGVVGLLATACGGRTAGGPSGGQQLGVTTKAGTKPVDKGGWAVYRDVNSLDPIFAFDYPENTTDSLLYDSLLRQDPDGPLGPGHGTPAGKIMGTGAFKFESWKPGVAVVIVRNDSYWNPAVKPLVREMDIKGAPNDASLTSALLTGGINGVYAQALTTLDQLKTNKAVTVTYGPGWYTDAFIVSDLKGALGDVRVRQALSLALDRKGLIDAIYKGTATLPKWISNRGTFGYGKSVFEAAYAAAPDMTQNLAKAKQLIIDAGATGKSITIGMSSELTGISIEANALKAAAEAIGMKATLHSVSAQNFINFFIDPKARVGIDGFFTLNYGDYAGPESLLATLIPPDGSQNFDGYGVQGTDPQAANDSKAFTLFDEARSTADPNARAQKVADVEKMIATDPSSSSTGTG